MRGTGPLFGTPPDRYNKTGNHPMVGRCRLIIRRSVRSQSALAFQGPRGLIPGLGRSGDHPREHVLNEAGLGFLVGVAIIPELAGEAPLQLAIFPGDFVMGPEMIAEGHNLPPLLALMLDHME